jgi:hypothetical protein
VRGDCRVSSSFSPYTTEYVASAPDGIGTKVPGLRGKVPKGSASSRHHEETIQSWVGQTLATGGTHLVCPAGLRDRLRATATRSLRPPHEGNSTQGVRDRSSFSLEGSKREGSP